MSTLTISMITFLITLLVYCLCKTASLNPPKAEDRIEDEVQEDTTIVPEPVKEKARRKKKVPKKRYPSSPWKPPG